ncbi:MAG: hypothetical protein RMY28_003275, partial [Nostoc sp. ChiSLP01]|nr:hypothetical protein [Nostoc sp. CmiSLP01]
SFSKIQHLRAHLRNLGYIARGRRQEAGGKTITIPSIQACHYVLTYVATAIHLLPHGELVLQWFLGIYSKKQAKRLKNLFLLGFY